MNNRNYNIYFHTHTISGIIIAALLYVIFFAGSFSFFKDQISAWQSNTSQTMQQQSFDYGFLLDSLDQKYDMSGRNLMLYLYPNSTQCYVTMEASQDTLHNLKAKETAYFGYDFAKKKEQSYEESYDLGEFLYRLHFLAQLNQAIPLNIGYPAGYIIAGFVAFLFLFALITGLLLHWDKLVANFFQFRPWAKWKTIWTDLHTVLGVIGFPFQLIFAFTGIILIVNTVLLLPFSELLYQGDMEKVYQELEYEPAIEASFINKQISAIPDVQQYIDRTHLMWPNASFSRIVIKNYGDKSMVLGITAEADHKQSFAGSGEVVYAMNTGKIIKQHSPYDEPSYIARMKSIVYRLHFGDYGGYFVKIANFILGITGCVVIISGIMIWLVARDKKNVPAHKRKFNFWLCNIFLAICLSMFPVTAFTFIAVKALGDVNQVMIYQIYFYSWLVFSLYYIARKNLNRTNRETLLLGALLSFLVPVSNGIFADNWLWHTWARGAKDIFFLDLFWLVLAIVTFIAYKKIKKQAKVYPPAAKPEQLVRMA